MAIKDTLSNAHSKWMEDSGPDNDVVISSRIRLARNLIGLPFPHFMSDADARKVIGAVQTAISQKSMIKKMGQLEFSEISKLSSIEREILVEKHLVSPHHIENPVNRAVIIASDETVSIMVNEEDHLRIQCILSGLQIEETWNLADKIDDLLEQVLDFSFCEKRGYLTSCPTNVGTGLRASVMLHLPGLVMAKQVAQIVHAMSQIGLVVRGYYGEGTEASGNLFQISNQVTIGQTEAEIVKNLTAVTNQIVTQERSTREAVYRDNRQFLEDRIYRALGTMRYARMVSSREALKNISDIRLGVELGILKGLTFDRINELIILTRAAFLMVRAAQQLTSEEINFLRADVIREKLSDIKIN